MALQEKIYKYFEQLLGEMMANIAFKEEGYLEEHAVVGKPYQEIKDGNGMMKSQQVNSQQVNKTQMNNVENC